LLQKQDPLEVGQLILVYLLKVWQPANVLHLLLHLLLLLQALDFNQLLNGVELIRVPNVGELLLENLKLLLLLGAEVRLGLLLLVLLLLLLLVLWRRALLCWACVRLVRLGLQVLWHLLLLLLLLRMLL